MARKLVLSGSIGILAFLLCINSFAQLTDLGNFRAYVSTGVEVTDNRDATKDKKGNADVFLRPRIELGDPTHPSLALLFFVEPTLRYRTEPNKQLGTAQNDSDIYYNMGLEFNNSADAATKIKINERFNYTDDPAVTEGGTTLRGDSSYILNTLSLGIEQKISRLTGVDFGVRDMMKKYSEQLAAKESDQEDIGASASMLMYLKPHRSFLGGLDYSQTGYKKVSGYNRDFQSFIVQAGFEEMVQKDLRASIRVGYQNVQYDDASIASESQPAAIVTVTKIVSKVIRLSGGMDYRIRTSDIFPYSSQSATDFNMSGEWDINKQFRVLVLGIYHMGEYKAKDATGVSAATDGNEKLYTIEASLGYSFDEDGKSSLKLSQRYEQRTSDIDSGNRDFDRNTTSLSYSQKF